MLMKKVNCFMGLCHRFMQNLYPSAQLSAHNPVSSMAMEETKTLELVLKGSKLTISADDFGHNALDMVQASADRSYDRLVTQDGF